MLIPEIFPSTKSGVVNVADILLSFIKRRSDVNVKISIDLV